MLTVGQKPPREIWIGTGSGAVPVAEVHYGTSDGLVKVWPVGGAGEPARKREVTVNAVSRGVLGWDASPKGDTEIVVDIESTYVSFSVDVTCDRQVQDWTAYRSVSPGQVIRARSQIGPIGSGAFVFTEA